MFQHFDYYRRVMLRGTEYRLSPRQASVAKMLHEARQEGIVQLPKKEILERLGSPDSRWQDVFRSNPEVKRELIVNGDNGMARLNY